MAINSLRSGRIIAYLSEKDGNEIDNSYKFK